MEQTPVPSPLSTRETGAEPEVQEALPPAGVWGSAPPSPRRYTLSQPSAMRCRSSLRGLRPLRAS